MNVNQTISKWIRSSRESAELSGEALGRKLQLELGIERGITKANISHWETGKHLPNLSQLLAVAKITRCKLPEEVTQAMTAQPLSVVRNAELDDEEPTARELIELCRLYLACPKDEREWAFLSLQSSVDRISGKAVSNDG